MFRQTHELEDFVDNSHAQIIKYPPRRPRISGIGKSNERYADAILFISRRYFIIDSIIDAFWTPADLDESYIAETARLSVIPSRAKDITAFDHAIIARFGGKDLATRAPAAIHQFSDTIHYDGNTWHQGAGYYTIIKGAPEPILDLCDLTENERERAQNAIRTLNANGQSVIALADIHHDKLFQQHTLPHYMNLVALISYVPKYNTQLIHRAADLLSQGATIYIETGDYSEGALEFAQHIDKDISINEVFDARLLNIFPRNLAVQSIRDCRVFSHITPHRHELIIRAIQPKN